MHMADGWLERRAGLIVGAAATALVLSVAAAALGEGRGRLGDFDGHADVGSPRIAGTATYNAVSQEYGLSAGGVNMWATRDEFHFAWKRMTGDFILQARVEFLGTGIDPHRKAGWIVRPTRDADAPYVDGVVHGDGLTSLQFRRTRGGLTAQKELAIKGADVIQLERKGGTYVFSAAKYGEPFTSAEIGDIDLGDEVLVGIALCSHNPDVTERATFSDVRIIRPARDTFVPYRDFIGSVLEILDLGSGHRKAVYRSEQPFEAPNWTADGAALIYNRSGRGEGWGGLYRFDIATRQPALIDTGVANRNNNDHVLSFDGTMLGMSDQSPASGGRSTIYTVPAGGGTPKRVTTLSPSYLHSWSPDGKDLIFTGGRNDEFDIYRIPADGSGPEVRLTDYKGLDDGPEYTPDGRYIYFNSVRSGTMQIWRMAPDGSDPEQITHDEYNNWFPHISPDGRWMVFISFPKEVAPADHPYYKRVYLRLMPIHDMAQPGTDGARRPRVIAYVYGGQGTINVPSWSPDGKMIAFVSNTDAY
jgi:TolB protein